MRSRWITICLSLSWLAIGAMSALLWLALAETREARDEMERLEQRIRRIESRPVVYKWKEDRDAGNGMDKSGER